jgi:hypothetical protein
MAVSCY